MNEHNLPLIEPLLTLTAQTTLVRHVTDMPAGDRRIVDVLGGSFEGPRLSGVVPATGGDWVIQTPAGSQLDVRLLLETHDGATILFQYTGRACMDNGKLRLEVAGTFDAPRGAYDWLNHVQAFGRGSVTADGVQYHFYRFK